MLSWDDLQIFLAAFRTRSQGRAAEELSLNARTISRRLVALEASVGKRLFARTPDGLAPTAAALALLPHAEAVERAALAGAAALGALDENTEPAGEVRVSLPGDMLSLVLLPRLPAWMADHPRITLSLDQSNTAADLSRLESDIAVRISRPTADSDDLISTRLRDVPLGFFGARAYLATVPAPQRAAAHRFVAWAREMDDSAEMQWLYASIPSFSPVLRVNSLTSLRQAAAAGAGVALLPRLFAALTPTLVEIPLEDVPPPPALPLYLITHRVLRERPAVSAVWDFLSDWLRHRPERDDLALLRPLNAQAYGTTFADG